MKRKRLIRPPKVIAVCAAIAVGVFLSVASHAFNWSEASTLAVACALVALLAMFGPALFLMEESPSDAAPPIFALHSARLAAASESAANPPLDNLNPNTARIGYATFVNRDDRSWRSMNRAEDFAFTEDRGDGPQLRGLPQRENVGRELGSFLESSQRRDVVDLGNAALFQSPEEVMLTGRHA